MKKQPTFYSTLRRLLVELRSAVREALINLQLARLKTKDESFKKNLKLLNRLAWYKGSKGVVFTYDTDTKLYAVNEDEAWHYFTDAYRGACLYLGGIKSRARGLASSYLINDLDFAPGDIVVDCGANYGDLCRYFELYHPEVCVHAYEPSPSAYMALARNLEKNSKFFARPVALGNQKQEVDFYLSPRSGDCSVIAPCEYEERVAVKMETLDNEMQSCQTIKLLKIEAEGFEPEVLGGASATLDKTTYVAVDVGPERGVEKQTTVQDVTDLLMKRGFFVCNVDMAISKGRRMLFKKTSNTQLESENS